MAEYYVKFTPESEAQGPLTPADLQTLAAAQKISPTTLHYFDDVTGWQPLSANQALCEQLWPSKKRLSLKKKEEPAPEAAPAKPSPTSARTVEQMLQAAQGKTSESKVATAQKRWSDRTAALSLPFLGLLHLIMGGLMLFSNWQVLSEGLAKSDWMGLLMSPAVAMGGLLAIIGLALLMGVAAVYSWARYTSLMLMGYWAIHSWVALYTGQSSVGWALMAAALGWGLGIYTITVTLNFSFFVVSLIAAWCGVLAYGWVCFLA